MQSSCWASVISRNSGDLTGGLETSGYLPIREVTSELRRLSWSTSAACFSCRRRNSFLLAWVRHAEVLAGGDGGVAFFHPGIDAERQVCDLVVFVVRRSGYTAG